MSPIAYRLRRALRQHPGTPVLLSLMIAMALGLVLTLVAGSVRTLSAADRYTSTFGDGFEARIEQAGGPTRDGEIAGLPAVEEVESITFVFAGLFGTSSEEPLGSLVFVGSHLATGSHLVGGREPDPSVAGEFVATQSFLDVSGSQIGDSFELLTFTSSQSDATGFDGEPAGPTTTATLVGVIEGATELQDAYPYTVFPRSLLDIGDIGISATQSVVRLTPGATLDDLRTQLDTLEGGSTFAIGRIDLVPPTVRSAIDAQGQGLAVLALFAGAAAVTVIGQLLGRQHRLADAERLALRTIGMTPPQLVADPLCRAAVPVAVGAGGGAVIAIACSGVFPTGFVADVEPDAGVRFDALVHVLGPVVLGALLIGWVAFGLAMADRVRRPSASPPVVEAVATRLRPAHLATAFRFAFTGASGRRWAMPSFVGLVVVLGVIVGATTLGANLGRLVDEPVRYGSASLQMGSGGGEIPDDVRLTLEADPDIAALTFYSNVPVPVGAYTLDVTGMRPVRGDLSPDVLSGRLPQADDEIALGTVAARDLAVSVGDEIVVGAANDPKPLRVTGVAIVPGVEGGEGLGEGGVVTASGLARIDPTATMDVAAIELRPGAPATTAERLSSVTGMALGRSDPPSVILNIDRIRSIPFLVAAILAGFALLSLTHQLLVSARHRRRDIGILKALGADRGFVTSVIHFQASVFTATLIAVAVPIGVIAGQSVFRIYASGIGARGTAMVPTTTIIAAIAAIAVLANAVAVVPAWRAQGLEPTTDLNQE